MRRHDRFEFAKRRVMRGISDVKRKCLFRDWIALNQFLREFEGFLGLIEDLICKRLVCTGHLVIRLLSFCFEIKLRGLLPVLFADGNSGKIRKDSEFMAWVQVV